MPVDDKCKPHVLLAEGAVTHLAGSRCAAVRGKEPLASGVYRLSYQITSSSSPAGYGIVLGVCSCEDPDSSAAAANRAKTIQDDSGLTGSFVFSPFGRTNGWGLSPSTGRLVRTDTLTNDGIFDGGKLGKELTDVPMKHARTASGMIVVIELTLPALDSEAAAIARRNFSQTLHPLDMRKSRQPALGQTGYGSMAFSVNGGPMVDAGVLSLPTTLYPWVAVTREGDAVNLASIEKLSDL